MDERSGRDWRDWAPPPPFVTHSQWADMREEMGALKNGHTHILQTYTHIRGEMREGFDRIERAMTARDVDVTSANSGVNLSVRELVLLIVAIAAAAVILTYMFVTGNPGAAKELAG